jgi:hypothetical protein
VERGGLDASIDRAPHPGDVAVDEQGGQDVAVVAGDQPAASRTTGRRSKVNWAASWTEAGPNPSR